jgi:hypothetical protein
MFSAIFPKIAPLWDNTEKCDGDRGATNDVTIWRVRIACWISKAACTHVHACIHRPVSNTYCFSTATVIFANAPHCYVVIQEQKSFLSLISPGFYEALVCCVFHSVTTSGVSDASQNRRRSWLLILFLMTRLFSTADDVDSGCRCT